ncbi:MAG TPA: GntR family transcriptional regulator [Terriglobia bacterium]|nr:GntR family transcriptional regulator [Terriglobia bacterium]
MDIRISKESEVPLRQQVAEQIIMLIVTEKLKAGDALPSVRELARRLKIHHNTISHAYQDLEQRHWAVNRRGSHHLVIRAPEDPIGSADQQDLDELINVTIEMARRRGYSLEALRNRVRERLLAQPPDHILVVEEEAGLRQLLQAEIREAVKWPVQGCSRGDLARNPDLVLGALAVTPQYAIGDTEPLVSKERPAIPIAFCGADDHVQMLRKLGEPSVIAVVSVSQYLLQAAQGLLASAVGRRHTLTTHLLPLASSNALGGADVILCDSIALREVKNPKRLHYRLSSPASMHYLSNAMQSYQDVKSKKKDGKL